MRLDFVVAGVPKAGTTWCWAALDASPDFFVPSAKDLYYFDRHHARGTDWYERHFEKALPGQLRGEVCHDYVYSKAAWTRIDDYSNGECVFVLVLRNPVDRALSQLRYSMQMGHIRSLDLEVALEDDPLILRNSRYEDFLEPVKKHFGARLQILIYEDLHASPDCFMGSLFEACGGQRHSELPDIPPANVSGQARSPAMMSVARKGISLADRMGRRDLIGRLKNSPLRRAFIHQAGSYGPLLDQREALSGELSSSVLESSNFLADEYGVVTSWTL